MSRDDHRRADHYKMKPRPTQKTSYIAGRMNRESRLMPAFLGVLMLSSLQPSVATTNASSSQTEDVEDYIARTFPQLCPYEPLCYQTAMKTATGDMGSCCLPCSCRDHCHLLSNCCPDKRQETEESTRKIALSADMFTCSSSKIGPIRGAKFYSMVSKCPLDTATTELGLKCESLDDPPVSALIPATDLDTGITYRNVHCSQCHGISGELPWSMTVHCRMNLLQSAAFGEISSISSLLDGHCEVIFSPPKEIDVGSDSCFPSAYKTCKETGHWRSQEASELMIEACESWGTAFTGIYGNVYCAICNGMPVSRDDACSLSSRSPVTQTSFIATIRYDSDASEEGQDEGKDRHDVCPAGSLMDPYLETCRNIVCPQFSHLVRGQCEKILKNYGSLNMLLVLKLATDDIPFFEKESVNSKKGAARKYLKFLTNDRQDLKISLRDVAETAEDFPGTPYLAVLATVSTQSVPDPDILQWIYDRLNLPFTYTTPAGQGFMFHASVNPRIHIAFMNYVSKNFYAAPDTALTDLAANSTLVSLYHKQVVAEEFAGIPLSRLLFCPQIRLNQSEYEDFGLSIVLLASNTTLYTIELMRTRSSPDVRVCVQDYLAEPPTEHLIVHSPGFNIGWVYALVVVVTFCLVAAGLAGAIYRHRRLSRTPASSS